MTGQEAKAFAEKLENLSDEEFVALLTECIGQAAQSAANTGTDFSVHHDQADLGYYEAKRRGNPGLYQQAFDAAYKSAIPPRPERR